MADYYAGESRLLPTKSLATQRSVESRSSLQLNASETACLCRPNVNRCISTRHINIGIAAAQPLGPAPSIRKYVIRHDPVPFTPTHQSCQVTSALSEFCPHISMDFQVAVFQEHLCLENSVRVIFLSPHAQPIVTSLTYVTKQYQVTCTNHKVPIRMVS